MGLPPKLFEIYPHFLRTRPSSNVADHHDHTCGAYYVSSRYREPRNILWTPEVSGCANNHSTARDGWTVRSLGPQGTVTCALDCMLWVRCNSSNGCRVSLPPGGPKIGNKFAISRIDRMTTVAESVRE